ncbi:MAG: GNAT family N-acetyltransferase, partial [bacterium]
ATSVTEYLKGEFGRNKEYGPEVIEEVTDKMLRAGRAILEKFVADKISEGEDRPLQNVGKELEKTRVDIISFTSAFKTLKETGIEFSLSDVKDLEISTVNSSDISDKDIKFMEKLYSLNYIRYPKLADYLVNKFNEAMHDPASTVSILRRNGEIVAFYRLEPNGQENSFYFGSFNVDPTYQGSSLGETLMQESLDVKAKDNIIFAECNPKVAVSANYIERGFIAVNSGHIEEIDILNIVRNDKMNTKLASRALSMNDILDGRFPNDKINVRTIPINNLSDLSFDFVGSKHGVQTEVLTRYIRDKKAGFIYLVTEQVDDSFVEQYSSSAQFIPQPNSEMEAVAA